MLNRLRARLRDSCAKIGINALQLSGCYRGYWQHWRGPLFDYAEQRGVHVLPVHYYTPIPSAFDTSRRRPNRMAGVHIDRLAGSSRAASLLTRYSTGINGLLSGSKGYDPSNSGFHPLDAALLYASVRDARPKRIIEIGSGMSTFAIAAAIEDSETSISLTCIEPFLPPYLRNGAVEANIIESPLQEVPLVTFQELEAGDILFIDSTHVVRFDSDVVFEILEILPILKSGVIIHIHDIFMPDDYPEEWLKKHRYFWTEQYMLQAFLCMNPNFVVDIPVHMIKDSLDFECTSDAEPVSLWLRRI